MVNFFILWPAYYREFDEKSPVEKPSVGADTWGRPYRRRLCRKAIRRIHVFTVQSYNFSHWQWRKMAKCGADGVIW